MTQQTLIIISILISALSLVLVALLLLKVRKSSSLSEEIEKLKEFMHTSMESVNARLIESAKENQRQIEKNSELFDKILNASAELQIKLKDSLSDMSASLSSHLSDRLDAFNRNVNERLDSTGERVDKRLESSIERIVSSFEKEREESRKEFNLFIDRVEQKLEGISSRVDERLKEGFENVDKTFRDIVEGIAKISEAQKKIEELSSEVVSLQHILSDKKTRGLFGEMQLENILRAVFGDSNELYEIQYTLESAQGNRVIADAIIKAPQVGIIAVDSKFPLDNYSKMVETGESRYASLFKQDVKKHISDIASKYIIKGKTANMAIMFLPAEAIFAEIYAHHRDIVDYAYRNSVWIASPTTFIALLTTIQAVVRDIKTQKQAKKIQEELLKLAKNFQLYKTRWEKFIKEIEKVSKEAHDIHTTTQKISGIFDRIERVDFETKSIEKNPES